MHGLHTVDIIVFAAYFVALVAIGFWVGRGAKRRIADSTFTSTSTS